MRPADQAFQPGKNTGLRGRRAAAILERLRQALPPMSPPLRQHDTPTGATASGVAVAAQAV